MGRGGRKTGTGFLLLSGTVSWRRGAGAGSPDSNATPGLSFSPAVTRPALRETMARLGEGCWWLTLIALIPLLCDRVARLPYTIKSIEQAQEASG